jgi:hypothetical protein
MRKETGYYKSNQEKFSFCPGMELMAEILALHQQLAILNRTANRPSLRFQDRLFWVTLAQCWQDWRSALLIVKPETVIKWHRQGFRLYWRWKSKTGRPGRPKIDTEIREIIRWTRFSAAGSWNADRRSDHRSPMAEWGLYKRLYMPSAGIRGSKTEDQP